MKAVATLPPFRPCARPAQSVSASQTDGRSLSTCAATVAAIALSSAIRCRTQHFNPLTGFPCETRIRVALICGGLKHPTAVGEKAWRTLVV
jgi:hypothetical protein